MHDDADSVGAPAPGWVIFLCVVVLGLLTLVAISIPISPQARLESLYTAEQQVMARMSPTAHEAAALRAANQRAGDLLTITRVPVAGGLRFDVTQRWTGAQPVHGCIGYSAAAGWGFTPNPCTGRAG